MRVGLIAEKVGMTQLFDDNGVRVPVTVLLIEPCTVVALRKKEIDGYSAVQLGIPCEKEKGINKPQLGYFNKIGLGNFKKLKEFRVCNEDEFNVGDILSVDHFKAGQLIDASGVSKGKGFAGAMKRHGFGGLRASHGVSVSHRSHGSTGNRTLPGRVFKNKKMFVFL